MALVQPICVDRNGTHENTIRAVMQSSFILYATRDPSTQPLWDEWLAGPFTKSIRRVSNFTKFLDSTKDGADSVYFQIEESQAAAFVPMEEFPPPIRKAQVANTELERRGWKDIDKYSITFAINPSLKMTTGKTAAQCAHAYFSYCMHYGMLTAFNITDNPAIFDRMRFNKSFGKGEYKGDYVEIHDAGYTEIAPNSLTVIAGPNPVKRTT